jgi:uncharacterized C2H2 Zn-finger protein
MDNMDHFKNFDDEEHFNLDMIMPEPSYKRKELEIQKKAPVNVQINRLKFKKGKKLMLRKNKELSNYFLTLERLGKIREKKTSNEPRIFDCHHPQCEKVFLDRNSYRKHLITHGEKQVKN